MGEGGSLTDEPDEKGTIRPDGFEEFREVNREVEVPIPGDMLPPDQVCRIELEVQLYDNDEGTRETRKQYIMELALEIHNRLLAKAGGWQRHKISYRSLELQADNSQEVVKEALEEAEQPPIAGKLTILH
jgi:hypothetical protein